METINPNQSLVPDKRQGNGGARQGAGRKPANIDPRFLAARTGLSPLHAQLILGQLIDERKQWLRVFACPDERVILQALMFLVSMRDGKPAQQINVTSQSINVSVDDIAKARAIVRELSQGVRGEEQAKPLMLREDEGGKLGG